MKIIEKILLILLVISSAFSQVEKEKTIREKVEFIVEAARENDCAIRIGVNCGSVDPDYKEKYKIFDHI